MDNPEKRSGCLSFQIFTCPIMCLYVLNSMLWCQLRFPHLKDVRFVFTSSCLYEDSCVIYIICACLHIVVCANHIEMTMAKFCSDAFNFWLYDIWQKDLITSLSIARIANFLKYHAIIIHEQMIFYLLILPLYYDYIWKFENQTPLTLTFCNSCLVVGHQ
jgi:hypothetical protein